MFVFGEVDFLNACRISGNPIEVKAGTAIRSIRPKDRKA